MKEKIKLKYDYKEILTKFQNLRNQQHLEKKIYYYINYLKKNIHRDQKQFYSHIRKFRPKLKVLPQIIAGKVKYYLHTY